MAPGDQDGRGRRPARQIALAVLGNTAVPLAALVTAPLIAHALGPAERGHLAAASAPVVLAIGVATVGIPEAATYVVAKNHRLARAVLRTGTQILIISAIIAAGAIAALAPLLTGSNRELRNAMLICGIATIPALALGALRGVAAGLHLWKYINREKYLLAVLRVLGILLLLSTGHLTFFTAAVTLAFSNALAGLAYLTARRATAAPAEAEQGDLRPTLLKFGAQVWLGSIAGILLSRIDQVLMTPLAASAELGYYAVAVAISDAPLILTAAARDVMLAADAGENSDRRLTMASRLTVLISTAVAVLIGATTPIWITPLFGATFSPATPVIWLLLIACVAGVPGSVAGAGLTARGLPHIRSILLVLALAVNIVLIILLVPKFGAIGAAIATVAGTIIASGGPLILMRLRYEVKIKEFVVLRRTDLAVLRTTLGSLAKRIR